MNLETTWLGMSLKNPMVPSASPLSQDLDSARRLEDAGAAALIMYSLFEEDLLAEQEQLSRLMEYQDLGHCEADSYLPVPGNYQTGLDEYLEQLQALKSALDIPVVASLNGASDNGWVEHGRELEQAGADALELNIYFIPDPDEDAATVEARYEAILKRLKQAVAIPVNIKLSPFFSSLGHLVGRLEAAGADGVSLFNRFYQPDLDLDSLKIRPELQYSLPYESLLRMHWIGKLHDRVSLSLGATGGIHGAEQALKMLLAGAHVVHQCSVLLEQGPQALTRTLDGIVTWMEEQEYESLRQLIGSSCQNRAINPEAWDRLNYIRTLRND
jgi:dihydroorotate dehydrogenase (fumarate)